jgi:hypothetical protein
MIAAPDFEPYLERLRELSFVSAAAIDPRRPPGETDALVKISTPSGPVRLPAELKRSHLTRELGHRLVHLAKALPGLLVLAPVVGRDLGEEFADAGVNFIDLAGNCHLRIGKGYVARVQGRRVATSTAEKGLRAPSYRVLFALLADASLAGATSRALAERAGGVSAQTAIDLRTRLCERRILVPRGKALDWAPSGRKEALDTFVAGFVPTLEPSLAIGRFRPFESNLARLEAQLFRELGGGASCRFGGGAACDRLTGHFRGDRTVIYVTKWPGSGFLAKARLIADPAGTVSFAHSPGPLAFESPNSQTVHPLLAYADLLSDPDERAHEGAAEVYARHLAKAFDSR